MRSIFRVLSVMVLFALILCPLGCAEKPKVGGLQERLIVSYTTFQGNPVEFVYEVYAGETLGRVSIRVVHLNGNDWHPFTDNNDLNFLTGEVVRLTSGASPLRLGDTDFFFEYHKGRPIWAPYYEMDSGKGMTCLFFGERAALKQPGGVPIFVAKGTPFKEPGHSPYPEL